MRSLISFIKQLNTLTFLKSCRYPHEEGRGKIRMHNVKMRRAHRASSRIKSAESATRLQNLAAATPSPRDGFPTRLGHQPLAKYEIAAPIVPATAAAHTMELLAQLRPTGHILDGFRISLDGAVLSRSLDLGQIIPTTVFKGYNLQAKIPAMADVHPHLPQHAKFSMDGRSGPDVCQQRTGPQQQRSRNFGCRIHGAAGHNPGQWPGVRLTEMGRYHWGGQPP
jgi:hypothetical protein